jgi:hypothetical protein
MEIAENNGDPTERSFDLLDPHGSFRLADDCDESTDLTLWLLCGYSVLSVVQPGAAESPAVSPGAYNRSGFTVRGSKL